MRGPVCIIFSKQRATCSQEKWELTISQAARETRARISGLARSSRQWEAGGGCGRAVGGRQEGGGGVGGCGGWSEMEQWVCEVCIQPWVVRRKGGTLVAYLRDNGPPPTRAHIIFGLP